MITRDNISKILTAEPFLFTENRSVYSRHYGSDDEGFDLAYNAGTGEFLYPEGVIADRNTTKDEHQKESFVVFLCVAQLFAVGYLPKHLKLEGKNYAGTDRGYCDILVSDNDGNPYLIIECKTADVDKKDDEFRKHWAKTLRNGDQLFRYFNTYRKAKYLCLFAADFPEFTKEGRRENRFENIYHIISLVDNEEYLKTDSKLKSFQTLRENQGTSEEFFEVWKKTYKQDYNTRGLLEHGIEAFNIGRKSYSVDDLDTIDEYSLEKKYNEFAVILRKHTVSSHENAFDKLVNLFLSKIIDEKYNARELTLLWKGAAYDDYFSLQDRLNILYRQGMKEFFDDDVTYVENRQIDDAFTFLTSKADVARDTIKKYFRELKYFNNNPFAFLDVHNEELFFQNAVILKDVITMLQDIYLTRNTDNQFLGDLFEGYLKKGVHQSEGQFFTPIPIVRFIVSSLPLRSIVESHNDIPKAIDYACGAGHFLTEYARQIKPFVDELKRADIHDYYKQIIGIEKDYRLSKVSQVAAFMYGMDGIHIHFADGLSEIDGVRDDSFDVLVANPPYSVSGFLETMPEEHRDKYTLTKYVSNIEKNNSIETFFTERSAQLLRSGGVAAIILPSSVLSKGGIYMRTREILLQQFDIIAISQFGGGTFGQTSTSTIVLFLRRKQREPQQAEHYRNRVNEWFRGNQADDDSYGDTRLLDAYLERVGFSREDYQQLMQGHLTDDLLATDMVQEYLKALNLHKKSANKSLPSLTDEAKQAKSEAQSFVASRTYKQMSPQTQHEHDRLWMCRFIKAIEKEKLYYFMLAASQEQPVIITKNPEKKDEEKRFLGYEWSNRKGDEGIKYLNVQSSAKSASDDEENDDDTLSQLKGIDGIVTPLFNPLNLADESKINTLIRQNFCLELEAIPEELSDYVESYPLTDLIDFSLAQFDKAIKTTPILSYPQMESKFPAEKLGSVAPFVNDKVAFADTDIALYVSTTNMLQMRGGVQPYDGTPEVGRVTAYKRGDTLISNIRPYLKKIWMADHDGGCSNDVLVFRSSDPSKVSPDFLNVILSTDLFFDYMMVGKTGLKMPRGDKKAIPNFLVPIPPKDVQQKIVEECREVDEVYSQSNNIAKESEEAIHNLILKIGEPRTLTIEALCEELYAGGDKPLAFSKTKTETLNVPVFSNGTGSNALFGYTDKAKTTKRCVTIAARGTIGYTILHEEPFVPIVRLIVAIPNEQVILAKFFKYALDQVEFVNTGGATPQLTVPQVANYQIPVPSLSEQQRIVSEIEVFEQRIAEARSIMNGCAARKQAILDRYLK